VLVDLQISLSEGPQSSCSRSCSPGEQTHSQSSDDRFKPPNSSCSLLGVSKLKLRLSARGARCLLLLLSDGKTAIDFPLDPTPSSRWRVSECCCLSAVPFRNKEPRASAPHLQVSTGAALQVLPCSRVCSTSVEMLLSTSRCSMDNQRCKLSASRRLERSSSSCSLSPARDSSRVRARASIISLSLSLFYQSVGAGSGLGGQAEAASARAKGSSSAARRGEGVTAVQSALSLSKGKDTSDILES
jgi:hypothetical protein